MGWCAEGSCDVGSSCDDTNAECDAGCCVEHVAGDRSRAEATRDKAERSRTSDEEASSVDGVREVESHGSTDEG